MKEIIFDNVKYFMLTEDEMNNFKKDDIDKEILNPYPKIISFRDKQLKNTLLYTINDNNYYLNDDCYPYTLNDMLYSRNCVNSGGIEIYQVAKNKNEIFTIGDKVKNADNKSFIINEFRFFEKYGITVVNFENNINQYIEYIEKFKEPLLTTEDGVEIFDEQELLYDTTDNNPCFLIDSKTPAYCFILWKKNNDCLDRKCWYHKENAKKYVEENKLRYSNKDIEKILGKNYLETLKLNINNK